MHSHAPAPNVAAAHRGRLAVVLALVLVLLVVEVTVAILTGSLALLSDAGHLATDVIGLSLALGAVTVAASQLPTARTSFGWYRLEILAALANALLLLGVAIAVFVGVLRRWNDPHPVDPGPLLIVASVALAINVLCAWLLRPGAEESLNLRGARLEVLADAAGSIGVLVTAVVIHLTGWTRIDSVMALAIVGWLLPRALRLGYQALRVLLQHAPDHLDVDGLERDIGRLPGVTGVHDLHVWTLTSGMEVASLHVEVADGDRQHEIRHTVRDLIAKHAGIDHVTVQIELSDDPACCEDHPSGW
jgi:cobalt-zinc-cadmium efflux system protein